MINIRREWVLLFTLWISVGCAITVTPTPSPSPTATPPPGATIEMPTQMLPTPTGNHLAPADVPACQGAQNLEQPIEFSWAGIEDIVQNAPESHWTFYRCNEPLSVVTTRYRQWLPLPQYSWTRYQWEERANATLGVFYYSTSALGVPNRWLYLWFLPDSSSKQISYLAAIWWEVPKGC